ncbi:MAG: hypothetical protein ACXVDI_25200 [Ktedonobacterales bacterium]
MFDDDEREQMPLEAREIHQQLLSDSSHWARGLPADTHIAEFARALPQRMPAPSARQTRNVLVHRRPSSTLPDMMSVKGQSNMLKIEGPRRTVAASIAAVAVVALIVGVLYSANIAHDLGGGIHMDYAPPTLSKMLTPTPGSLGVAPGPQAKYISEIVTAGGRSSDGTPTQVKSHFLVGDYVYVLAVVRGLPKGAHTISIRWYLNGVFVELPASPQTSQTIDGDKRVIFGLQYPSSGLGAAKIYIDRPASDTGESPSDPSLAGTVTFVVEMPQPPQQPGGPTPTPFVPTPTATPHQ